MKENTVRKVICIVRSRHFPSCPQSTVKQPKARSVIYRRTTDSPGDQRRMYSQVLTRYWQAGCSEDLVIQCVDGQLYRVRQTRVQLCKVTYLPISPRLVISWNGSEGKIRRGKHSLCLSRTILNIQRENFNIEDLFLTFLDLQIHNFLYEFIFLCFKTQTFSGIHTSLTSQT